MFSWLLKVLYTKDSKIGIRALKDLGKRHESMNIKREYYLPMKLALFEALQDTFSQNFTLEVEVAIDYVYQTAAEHMIEYDASFVSLF